MRNEKTFTYIQLLHEFGDDCIIFKDFLNLRLIMGSYELVRQISISFYPKKKSVQIFRKNAKIIV